MNHPSLQKKLTKISALLKRSWPLWVLMSVVCLGLLYWFWDPLLSGGYKLYHLLTERERLKAYVASFGPAAPIAFMGIQVLQVVLAPIPGEFTGLVGGYFFGAAAGCLYSSVALTIGSIINFGIGRFLGKRWIRRWIPSHRYDRFNHLMRHQGVLVAFILFLVPGFPKDYLCIFLGVSTIPARVFIIIAAIGRIPGTLMLSLQGALVFEKNYLLFCLVVASNLIMVYFAYRQREALYRWVEKINHQQNATIDEDPK